MWRYVRFQRINMDRSASKRAGMFEERAVTLNRMQKIAYLPIFEADDELSDLMEKMIHSKGILFTGKGASGKTTLMNAMIAEIPYDESVMICQENAELLI